MNDKSQPKLNIYHSLLYSEYISGKMFALSRTRDFHLFYFRSEQPFYTRGIEGTPFLFGKYLFHKE